MKTLPITQLSSLTDRQLLEMIYARLLELETGYKDTLSLKEAAEYSTYSESCLYKKLESRKIGHFKPDGGKLFIDRKELESHMRTNRILSMDEMKDKGANHLRKSA